MWIAGPEGSVCRIGVHGLRIWTGGDACGRLASNERASEAPRAPAAPGRIAPNRGDARTGSRRRATVARTARLSRHPAAAPAAPGGLGSRGRAPKSVVAVVERGAGGAINITASHNPPTDNGFKVRDEHGGAIPPAGLKQIEELIP
ncbi:MAG: hypothetical protein N2038_06485, partial [Geminicoccaceae bacterium]|nr:hypothetical protein [Geminicoccaceae bacterium]